MSTAKWKPLFKDPDQPLEVRVRDLLSRMTLEEKVAQLCSVSVRDLLVDGEFSEEKAKQLLGDGIGQITRISGWSGRDPQRAARLANQIQRFLVNNTRLGVPALVHEECLSGFMTAGAATFPQAINLASTFDPEALEQMTNAIRRQMRTVGSHQGLSPVLDVARDPRWGRTEETFGEDPYLVAEMASAYVRGLQGEDLRTGVVATLKHFAGHSFSEGGRNRAPVHVGPRELREVFLFPFEVAVREAQAASVMNAYHEVDGIPCAASRELLTDILRGEWGFSGIVVADYSSVRMLYDFHKVAGSKMEAAVLALKAGIDVELPSIECYNELVKAVREGLLSEAVVDEAVSRHLRLKLRLGLFEDLYVADSQVLDFDTPEDRQLARRLAVESMVLLKNEGDLLPLGEDIKSLAVIGPNAAATKHLLGDYAYTAHLDTEEDAVRIVSVLEGIKNRAPAGMTVNYAKGCDVTGDDRSGFSEALAVAEESDVVVFVAGGNSGIFGVGTSGEGCDRTDLRLPGVQQELLSKLQQTGKPVVLVLVNGRPLCLQWAADNVPAILEAWLPGEEGGNALAQVLFGDYSPGGKLPVSLPKTVGQLPVNYNRKPTSYNKYIEMDAKPLYPFGHGLSYTEFAYSGLSIAPAEVKPGGEVEVSVVVENSGSRAGSETVQLYVRDQVSSLVRPRLELKGFRRLYLEPGEKARLTFVLAVDQLAFYDRKLRLIVEPGLFDVLIGSSSADIRCRGSFEVTGQVTEVGPARTYRSRSRVEKL